MSYSALWIANYPNPNPASGLRAPKGSRRMRLKALVERRALIRYYNNVFEQIINRWNLRDCVE